MYGNVEYIIQTRGGSNRYASAYILAFLYTFSLRNAVALSIVKCYIYVEEVYTIHFLVQNIQVHTLSYTLVIYITLKHDGYFNTKCC